MKPTIEPITLTGRFVTLEPLSPKHLEGLQFAVVDGELWKLFFANAPTPENMSAWLDSALASQEDNSALAFAVRENYSGDIVGTTRYYDIEAKHRKLKIGYTWYAHRVQRSAVNTECKLLLLSHVFNQLKYNAVEFRTDWLNQTSQRAIERLGAKRDGVLRSDVILPDGRVRDTVVYSIISNEWPGVFQNLNFKLNSRQPC